MLPEHFPDPFIHTPGSGEPSLRWGILGPGWIAGVWADTVAANTRQQLRAVGSRSVDRARAFAAAHGIATAHGSYEALVSDPEIDVVYIAVPQSEHLATGLSAIAAGKHVLIEKPLAMNRAEAEKLAGAGRETGVLVMEGMWSRYLPQASVIRTLVDDGILGEIRLVIADHGQAIPAGHRLLRPDLGGGALLDLGIYPMQLDSMVLGTPRGIRAIGALTSTGVDAYSTLVLDHGPGTQSTLFSSITTRTPGAGLIGGSEARLQLVDSINGPTRMILSDNGYFTPQRIWEDRTGLSDLAALAWEATALARFVGEGRLESPVHTLDETISIIDTLDQARSQLGVAAVASVSPSTADSL